MAMNVPLLSAEGEPTPQAGEYFLLKRGDISCSVHVAGQSKLKAKGVFYLSTHRIVFVSIPAHKYKFQSFEAPLRDIINEKFHQPIFGANYISGVATTTRLPNPAKFELKFNSGGVGTFLRLFFTMMEKYHDDNAARQRDFFRTVENGKFQQAQQAYFDPSDPSVVYVSQPAWQQTAAYSAVGGTDGKPPGMGMPAPAAAPGYHAAAAPVGDATGSGGRSEPPMYAATATPVATVVSAGAAAAPRSDPYAYGGGTYTYGGTTAAGTAAAVPIATDPAARTAFPPSPAYGSATYPGDGGGSGAGAGSY